MISRTLLIAVLACLSATAFLVPSVKADPKVFNPTTLQQSLELGRKYLLSSQRADGSFIYEIDAVRGVDLKTRNSVREMGGLWSLAVYHRREPSPETGNAILKALKHHAGHAKLTAAGGRLLCEPKAREGSTNTMALYILTLQDFLAAEYPLAPEVRESTQKHLDESIKFLLSLRLSNGRFASTYTCPDGRPLKEPSPYADGEALLALVRAAKQSEDAALRDVVLESGAIMYGWYVRSGLRANPHNVETIGFYQWGSMAFYELYTSGWPETQPYAARTIAMARWLLDVRKLLDARGNTAYAFEGLAVAWELARLTKDSTNQQYIGNAIERGLSKLMTWQIGSPLASDAIPKTFRKSPPVVGGVVMVEGEPRLRIDVTQHQMHALMLVQRFMFRPAATTAPKQ